MRGKIADKIDIIGILELEDDDFIRDVIGQLKEFQVEFVLGTEKLLPFKYDYSVIIDRCSYLYPYLRQLMLLTSIENTYVINNPFTSSIYNKILIHQLLERVGIKRPRTMILPKLEAENCPILKEPNWDEISEHVKLPCILKPFDGYGWENVYDVSTLSELQKLYYGIRNTNLMIVQEKIFYKEYYRVFCVNKKDVLIVKWIPKPFGLGEYLRTDPNEISSVSNFITEKTIAIHKILDLDFNAVEWCVDDLGDLYVIDVMNEVPEVDKKAIPEEYYNWIIDRFSTCVKEKARLKERNRTVFSFE